MSSEGSLLGLRTAAFSLHTQVAFPLLWEERDLPSSLKATNPILRAPLSWFNLTQITSYRSYVQIPSYWGVGLCHINLVETKIHSIAMILTYFIE